MKEIVPPDIRRVLLAAGENLDDYVIIGGSLPGFRSDSGELMAVLIEDDALAKACVEFLRARGNRVVDLSHE